MAEIDRLNFNYKEMRGYLEKAEDYIFELQELHKQYHKQHSELQKITQ